jgi:hypothetical protein
MAQTYAVSRSSKGRCKIDGVAAASGLHAPRCSLTDRTGRWRASSAVAPRVHHSDWGAAANASFKVRHLAESAVTVAEVFNELKDSAGKANATDLTLMPLNGLQVMEPTEESLRAGAYPHHHPPLPGLQPPRISTPAFQMLCICYTLPTQVGSVI